MYVEKIEGSGTPNGLRKRRTTEVETVASPISSGVEMGEKRFMLNADAGYKMMLFYKKKS